MTQTEQVLQFASSRLDVSCGEVAHLLEVRPQHASAVLQTLTRQGRMLNIGRGLYTYNSRYQKPILRKEEWNAHEYKGGVPQEGQAETSGEATPETTPEV